jgi:hypothetical protein
MPREEFEEQVRKAARAGTRLDPPRLVKARYWGAELDAQTKALVKGKGEWTVINPAADGGLLSLPDLRLALQNVKVGNSDAVLGEFDGKGQGLWVDKPGQHTVTFDWSLRGSMGIGELHYDLEVPACAAASLELTLPTDYLVTVARNTAVLSGPDFAGRPDRRVWRLAFAGRNRLHLVLRRVAGPAATQALILATMRSKQQLLPDRMLAEYRLEGLEVLHQPVQVLAIDCDAPLQPREVSWAGLPLKDWEVLPAPTPMKQMAKEKGTIKAAGPVLVVRLREPVQGPLPPLRIACETPLPPDGAWVSPSLRLRNALPPGELVEGGTSGAPKSPFEKLRNVVARGETLEVHSHPDLNLEGWESGGFRLLRTGTDEKGGQVLVLTAGKADAARPSARVKVGGPHATVRQTAWWQVGPRGNSFTAEFSFEVIRGRLFQLALRLPPVGKDGWQVERIELVEPKTLLRNWATTSDMGIRTLLVDLHHSLAAGDRAQLIVRLHSATVPPGTSGEVVLPFPVIGPVDAWPLAGVLGISVDPLYQVEVVQATASVGTPNQGSPWGKAPVTAFFEFRDLPVTGQLRLRARQPVIHASCRNELLLAPTGGGLKAHLTLDPVVGAPTAVDVYLSTRPSSGWQWTASDSRSEIRALERLPIREALPAFLAFGAVNPLARAMTFAGQPSGTYWRLRLARPLTRRVTFVLEMTWKPSLGPAKDQHQERMWDMPLVTVPTAAHLECEALVQMVGADLIRVQAEGMQEVGRPEPAKASTVIGPAAAVWRSFRYGSTHSGQLPRLRLWIRHLPRAADPGELCEVAHLTTRLGTDGRLVHRFSFRVQGWRTQEMPVELPSGVQVLAARVEGQWVDRLARQEREDGVRVLMPVPTGRDAVQFELVYASPGGSFGWLPWTRLEAAAPQLPVPPVAFRRTWQLPPGLAPLVPDARRLPDPGAPSGAETWAAFLHQGWQAGDGLLAAAGPPFAPDDWAAGQKRLLEDAAAALRKQLPVEAQLFLGSALEKLTLDHLGGSLPVVVDAVALRCAGVGPTTACLPVTLGRTPFWEALNLVHVPCRHGALLTTREQWHLWQSLTRITRLENDAVDEAVRQAARHGQDSSGRFWSVSNWCNAGIDGPGNYTTSPGQAGRFLAEGPGAGWTEWEPAVGADTTNMLIVVSRPAFHVLGLIAACLLLVLTWGLRRGTAARWRLHLLLLWLGAAGLAALWLPEPLRPAAWWPVLAGLAMALAWYVRVPRKTRLTPGYKSSPRTAAVASGVIFGLALVWPISRAGGPEPDTVLVLPGPPESPNKQVVLVTPDLLKKLETQAGRGNVPGLSAVLLSARYEGTVGKTSADFRADFQVYCGADKALLKVPLAGVDLKEGALLEGAFVYPVALPRGQAGYAIPVTGRKGQVVRLSLPFQVRPTISGDTHDLAFTIPRLVQSQLDLTLPSVAQLPMAVTGLGHQDLRKEGDRQRLRASLGLADLGRKDSAVHVNWRQSTGPQLAPAVQVAEYYLWNLSASVADLTAVLKYNVMAGAVSEVALDLPDGLEVRGVEAASLKPVAGPRSQVRLVGWDVAPRTGNRRRLTVHLGEPVTAPFLVTLGLVSRLQVAPGAISLPLPTPVRPALKKEGSAPGLLAYRVEGLEVADRPVHLGVVNVPFTQFARRWQELGMRELGSEEGGPAVGRAYSFRRALADAALELSLSVPRSAATGLLKWKVSERYMDLEASARLIAQAEHPNRPAEALTLIEWQVPGPIVVAQVDGPGVFRWNRSADRLQVWLHEPRQEAELRLSGWVRTVPGTAGKLLLPCVRLLTPRPTRTEIHLETAAGLGLVNTALTNLRPLASGAVAAFEAIDPVGPYAAAFHMRARAAPSAARNLTIVEANEEFATLSMRMHLDLPAANRQELTLRLRGWPTTDVRLEAPGLTSRNLTEGPGVQAWALRRSTVNLTHFSLKLSGRLALSGKVHVPVPVVELQGANLTERWLSILGNELTLEEMPDLVPVKDPVAELQHWPGEAELVQRHGRAWRVQREQARFRLALRSTASPAALTVVLAEQSAFAREGGTWLHQALYSLFADGGTELRLRLPARARLVTATLDGTPVALRTAKADVLDLALQTNPGPHLLRVRWEFESGLETLENPKLEQLRLPQQANYAVIWTIRVPPGFRQAAPAGSAQRPASAAFLDLERASAQVRLLELISERRQLNEVGPNLQTQLLAAHQRFVRQCRSAEGHLLSTPGAQADQGPKGQKLSVWLQEMRQHAQELTTRYGLPPIRSGVPPSPDSEGRAGWFPSAEELGTPIGWRKSAADRPPAAQLQPESAWQTREAVVATELLLCLLLGVWILSHLPRVTGLLRRLWPEQFVLLAVVGWAAFGPSLIGALLVIVAVFARLSIVGLWLGELLRRQPAPAGGSMASGK